MTLQPGGCSTLEILDGLAKGAFAELDHPDSSVWLQMNVHWWSKALRSPRLRESLCRTGIDLRRSALSEIISSAQRKAEVDPSLDPEAVARVLLSTWQGLVLQKALDPEVDVAGFLDVVMAMYSGSFWRGGRRES